jgi:hypothetical protein
VAVLGHGAHFDDQFGLTLEEVALGFKPAAWLEIVMTISSF